MEKDGHKWDKKCFIRFNQTAWIRNEPRLVFQTCHLEGQTHCAAFHLMEHDSQRINSESRRHNFPQVETHPGNRTRLSFVSVFCLCWIFFLFIHNEISSCFFFQLFSRMNFTSSPSSCFISHSEICNTSAAHRFGQNMTWKVCSSNSLFCCIPLCRSNAASSLAKGEKERWCWNTVWKETWCAKYSSLFPNAEVAPDLCGRLKQPSIQVKRLLCLTQSGVLHGRWGCFFKMFLPCFHYSVLGATRISESSCSSSSNCTEIHCLRENIEWLVQPQCLFMSGWSKNVTWHVIRSSLFSETVTPTSIKPLGVSTKQRT